MPFRWNAREHLSLGRYVFTWLLLTLPVGFLVGSACALFLWSLERATETRHENPWLLWLLPVGGVAIGLLYHVLGKNVEAGNNLIMDEIHEPGGGVPWRMAPLVLIGTVATHLFGGSAGREGTAIQMGGSIASGITRSLQRHLPVDAKVLLMAGVAAGFGGVFGTPLTGAIFAIEVLAIGQMSYAAIFPCLLASIISDWTCSAWGIPHTPYHVASLIDPALGTPMAHVSLILLAKVALAAIAFGLVSLLFAELTHGLKRVWQYLIPIPWLRPAGGAAVVIALVYLLGTRDYLGLGVTSPDSNGVSILSAFSVGGADAMSWWWKVLFTAVTLSAGFKGGEVTPLFFIGATLGNTAAWILGAPVDLFAAIGFVAVFAGATNTPLACTIMGVELFGPDHVVYFAVGCFVAYLFSGHSGIYLSQRIGTPKMDGELPADASLRSARDSAPSIFKTLRKWKRK